MNYTIKAINGKQIAVEFENGQTAKPVIAADLTPEEIDIEVGRYDSTYRKVGVPNTSISVGETRSTVNPNEPVPSNHKDPVETYDPYIIDLGRAPQYIDSLTLWILAEKEALAGNTELRDLIFSRVNDITSDPDYSYDQIVSSVKNTG